ncbi:MAG: type II toxin-antitoxin system PemK/MazF family toxin [Candidatus Daviesbacteria bacterium]|nr:type II toxin-antitoxin system PemK/MazF family toxin [Candidatus Daviesbacteria bacterium]
MGKLAIGKASHFALNVGSVVLVIFPFSNLKGQKVRPALVLANVEFDNLVLCQITSKPYTSKIAICIKSEDFAKGNLPVTSFVRPDKLFTADITIIKGVVGELSPGVKSKILKSVRKLFP